MYRGDIFVCRGKSSDDRSVGYLDTLTLLGAGEYLHFLRLLGFWTSESSLTSLPEPVYMFLGLFGIVRTLTPYILIALGIRWLYRKLKERANAERT